MPHIANRTASWAPLVVGLAATAVSAQTPITVIDGFNYQSWNAGTHEIGGNAWRPESAGTTWADGLRWTWQEGSPDRIPVFDANVPGITAAYHFPEARAATVNPDGAGNRGANWENNAQPGETASFELWFKSDDLEGTHVLWEIGAGNKGMAICLQEDPMTMQYGIVFLLKATDGAGGNEFLYEYRHPLNDTGWHQVALTFSNLTCRAFVDGVAVDAQDVLPASGTYRWTGANPAGLGTVGSDPAFPTASVAGDIIPFEEFTDFNGYIAIHRFYDVDLFVSEVEDNYNAITDADAQRRRSDYNGDGFVDANDQADLIGFLANSTNTPHGGLEFPFPTSGNAGGVQTNDPFMDETFVGDFGWNRDLGFNPTSQEPTFQFPAINVLEPVAVNDPAFPSIRTAFLLNGMEAFRGPKFEQADDTAALRVQFWLYVEDLVGNHCLFEAGGSGVGFSMVSLGDELAGFINTSATDGRDILEISSGPGVLQTGWRLFEIIVRRFVTDTRGQGFELYMDGQLVASANDGPGPDGIFNTEDDNDDMIVNPDNIFTPAGGGNSNFIGGNQGGYGQVQGSAALPAAATGLTPFNGMAGPFRMIQTQPLPDVILAEFLGDTGQDALNARCDLNSDGVADAFDALDGLRTINAGL